MKLNRWKRIGIIASVVWLLGAGGYTYYSEAKDIAHLASSATQTCLTMLTDQAGRAAECQKRGDSFREALPEVRYFALGVATIPVPLGWGLVYLAIFVGRWARCRWDALHGRTTTKIVVCAVILTFVLLTAKACWPPPPHAATTIWVGNADIKDDNSQDAVSAFAKAFAVEPACHGLTLSLNNMPSRPYWFMETYSANTNEEAEQGAPYKLSWWMVLSEDERSDVSRVESDGNRPLPEQAAQDICLIAGQKGGMVR
jgi:hypothetical protein